MERFFSFRPAARTAAAAIFCSAFSISYAQSFLGLSLLFALLESWRAKDRDRISDPIPTIFMAGFALFAWLIANWLIHYFFLSSTFRNLVRGETGDIFLCIAGLNVFYLTRDPDNRRIIYRGFLSFAVLVIISGAASAFTEHRLARWIYGKGFLSHSETRTQHLFTVIHDFAIYRPIGLLNTRLTYAGQLILILPFVFLEAGQKRKHRWIWIGLLLTGCAVLLINGTRSAILGLGFAGLIYLFQMLKNYSSITGYGFLVSAGVLILLGVWMNPEFLAGRQTDFQRPILWTGSFELFLNNWILGTGPGAFGNATLAWRESYALQHPTIWYYLLSTPSGHAHNDLLHLLAVGGIPAGLCFIAIMVRAPGSNNRNAAIISLGLIAFFVAGIAQCYFQDDEVVIIFWSLAGFASRLDLDRGTGSSVD
ncbi:MAG: O-antigen ligase family protein [Spirochaetia bacterium]|nr:O-antigen ligase family protein [Spirochaetia bacterium]